MEFNNNNNNINSDKNSIQDTTIESNEAFKANDNRTKIKLTDIKDVKSYLIKWGVICSVLILVFVGLFVGAFFIYPLDGGNDNVISVIVNCVLATIGISLSIYFAISSCVLKLKHLRELTKFPGKIEQITLANSSVEQHKERLAYVTIKVFSISDTSEPKNLYLLISKSSPEVIQQITFNAFVTEKGCVCLEDKSKK